MWAAPDDSASGFGRMVEFIQFSSATDLPIPKVTLAIAPYEKN
jgi:hypothetical protein